ncbi:MAG: formylglycine-generating enzyme family protein, partial [Candidatus Brocadia sp.]
FYMGRYPVTNEEYARFLKANPTVTEPAYWADRKYNQPKQPVVGVSWEDARHYAAWAGLRLPGEAEWEYACRAGSKTRYYSGDKDEDLARVGWYTKNSGGQLHAVGEKEPNGFGLYDMHGNVWEWIEDDWHDNYKGAPNDGRAWVDKRRGSDRVVRGGGWYGGAQGCRSAARSTATSTLASASPGQ